MILIAGHLPCLLRILAVLVTGAYTNMIDCFLVYVITSLFPQLL
jgi:hypothetical protein